MAGRLERMIHARVNMDRNVDVIFASNDDWRRLHLSSIIECAGYRVWTCATRHELFHLLARSLKLRPSDEPVLILDVHQADGQPASQIVALLHRNRMPIRVLVLADTSDESEVISCLREGAEDFLNYPVSPDDLLQSVYRISVLPNVG
jgi:DNA-binding NarL/FixJ family response regulator